MDASENEEMGSIFLKLLEDHPDPPLFCLHRALHGSSHTCVHHDSPPKSVPIPCTPLQLRKVTSLQTLELDSDTSSAGGWSFSMATPLNHSTLKGKPLLVSSLLSTTSEITTTEEECTDGSVSEGSSTKEEKLTRKRFLNNKNKPVIRTLFPRLTTPSTESPCSSPTLGSVGPSRMLTSANNHMTTSPKADSTVATVSLFESPLKEQAEQEEGIPCSQELFDSPEIFTPNLPAPANQSPIELDQCMEQSVWNKRVASSEMLLMTPAALSQPPVHSTPLHPHTPAGPPLSTTPLAPATIVCEAATPLMASTVATPTVGDEDVFDVLFMSRSQLESRFCTKNNNYQKRCDTQVEEFCHRDNMEADKSQPNEEKITRTPEAKTISRQSPTPEMKQPATKRKRLTTKAFSYPSKQQFNKPVRKRIRFKQSKREASVPINTPPAVNAESLSPRLKRARVESTSEERREERNDSLPPSPRGSSNTKENYVSEVDAMEPTVLSVDESVVNDEKDCITSQTETKTQEAQQHSVSQEEQMLVGEQDVRFDKQAKVTVSSTKQDTIMDINDDCVKPLPPMEPVFAVQETPPAKAQQFDSAMPQSLSKPSLTKVSGMRRSFAGSVHTIKDSNEPPEMSTAPDTRFVGFKTASGGLIAISATALDKAKQLIGEELEYEQSPADDKKVISTPLANTLTTISNTSIKNANEFTPSLIKTSSLTTSNQFQTPSTSKPTKPKPKLFKAPRSAASVSKAEEQASLSRILKKFGVKPISNSTPNVKTKEQKVETGFSTASGSKLSTSHTSLMKARRLLASDKENGIESPDITSVSGTEERSIGTRFETVSTKISGVREMTGFQTAAGKGLTVSVDLLENAKSEETHSPLPHTSRSSSEQFSAVGFQTASGKGIKVSSAAMARAKSIINSSEDNVSDKLDTPAPIIAMETGFKTGGGSAISVRRDSLQKAKQILSEEKDPCEIDTKETDYTSCLSALEVEHLYCFTQIDSKKPPRLAATAPEGDSPVLVKSEDENDEDCDEADVMDVSTGCYFNTQVVKQFLDFSVDEDSFVNEDPPKRDTSPKRDSSADPLLPETPDAVKRLVGISQAKSESQEKEPVFDPQSPDANLSIGIRLSDLEATFSSDHPSKLDLSSLSTVRDAFTKSMIDNMDSSVLSQADNKEESSPKIEEVNIPPQESSATTTEHAELESNSPSSSYPPLPEGPNNTEDMDTTLYVQESQQPTVPVEMSECGNDRDSPIDEPAHEGADNQTLCVNSITTNQGFDDVDIENLTNRPEVKVQTPSPKVMQTEESVPDTPPGGSTSKMTGFTGFMTAGGRKVDVSQQALEAVRLKFSNFDKEITEQTPVSENIPVNKLKSDFKERSFPGLQTASGKKVEVSKESLQAAKRTLGGETNSQIQWPVGLQTASGKQIEMSENSLQAARNTLQSSFGGLQTASGKKVTLSEESIRAAKATLDCATSQQCTIRSSTSFPGLQTASGQNVDISTEHLQAAKATLDRDHPVSNKLSTQPLKNMTLKTSLVDVPSTSTFQPPLKNVRSVGQSSADTTPTTKYKPIFKSGEQSVARKPATFGQPQRRLGSSKRGIVSTPEGSIQDRHPTHCHRPLVPTQTYLKEDGSYSISSHQQRLYTTPHRTRHQLSDPTHHHRDGDGRTRSDSGIVSRTSNVTTTPLGSGRSKNVVQPVWKGSIGAQKSKSTQRIQTGETVAQPKSNDGPKFMENQKERLLKPASIGTSIVHTPPDYQSSKPDDDPTLDSLHITLSQVFAMEESQQLLLDEGTKVTSEGGNKKEDSGYISREVSSMRSPTPEDGKTLAKETAGENGNGILTAEVAHDLLNDSLEMDCNDITIHESTSKKEQETEKVTPNRQEETLTHTPPTSTRPMSGTLLSVRSEYKRISLRSAIHHRPPGRHSVRELLSLGIHSSTVSVSFASALQYQFQGNRFFSNSVLRGSTVCVGDGVQLALNRGVVGLNEFWDGFRRSPGVDECLISFEWFSCHYKQLVWKLAAMEVSYPRLFAGWCLTPDWLLLQLKYRYDREIDQAERCALRKICEHDDLASRRMVLCIASINHEGIEQSLANNGHGNGNGETKHGHSCIDLTDGWYTLPCIIDRPLKHMIKNRKISIGTKLLIFGAELTGLNSPCHPLEVPQSCSLKISTNSTRRARWYAKLGYQATPHSYPIPLSAVYPDGGLVGCTEVMISRVYPLLFFEKREGAKGVFRSERQERKMAGSFEKKRQRRIEEICSRVQTKFEIEISKEDTGGGGRRRSRRLNTLQIKQLQDGEEIHTALTNAPDPAAFQELLSTTQRTLLESYHQSLVERRQGQLQERIRQAIQEAEEQLPQQRSVTPLLKVRVVPCGGHERVDCVLSVWRPDESLYGVLKEGSAVRITNLNTLALRSKFHHLQLTATRSTVYRPLPSASPQALALYTPRRCCSISYLHKEGSDCQLPHGELDIVGVVACITSGHVMSHGLEEGAKQQLDSVFLADSERRLLLVKIWDGLEAHFLQDVIQPGALLAVTNLTYRGLDHTHNVPTVTVRDMTVFSHRPTDQHLCTAMDQLRAALPEDMTDYLKTLQIPLDF